MRAIWSCISRWNSRARDWFADLTRVAQLQSPVTLAHLKGHRALKNAGWIRNNLVTRARATVDWPLVRELIVARNAALEARLPDVDGLMRATPRKRARTR
jgi:hypothetical protein